MLKFAENVAKKVSFSTLWRKKNMFNWYHWYFVFMFCLYVVLYVVEIHINQLIHEKNVKY